MREIEGNLVFGYPDTFFFKYLRLLGSRWTALTASCLFYYFKSLWVAAPQTDKILLTLALFSTLTRDLSELSSSSLPTVLSLFIPSMVFKRMNSTSELLTSKLRSFASRNDFYLYFVEGEFKWIYFFFEIFKILSTFKNLKVLFSYIFRLTLFVEYKYENK